VIRPTALVGRPGPDWLTGSGPAVPHGLTDQRGGTPLPLTGHLLAIRGGPHWPKGTGLPLTPLPDFPTGWPKGRLYPPLATRLTPSVPPTLTDWMAKGGGLASGWPLGGAGIFFRTYPHYPFGVGGRAFRPASLKHFSHTNRPVKPITEKAAIRGFLFIFGV